MGFRDSQLWIGVLVAEEGVYAALLPCLALWAALYTFGLLNEGRSYAREFETLRLLVVMPLAILGMTTDGVLSLRPAIMISLTAVYAVASLGLLARSFSDNSAQAA